MQHLHLQKFFTCSQKNFFTCAQNCGTKITPYKRGLQLHHKLGQRFPREVFPVYASFVIIG